MGRPFKGEGSVARASALEHHNAGNPNMFMRTSSSLAARLRFKRKLHFFLSVLSRRMRLRTIFLSRERFCGAWSLPVSYTHLTLPTNREV